MRYILSEHTPAINIRIDKSYELSIFQRECKFYVIYYLHVVIYDISISNCPGDNRWYVFFGGGDGVVSCNEILKSLKTQ